MDPRKPEDLKELQRQLRENSIHVLMSEHLAPPERPLAPVADPFDFSWCAGEIDGVGAPEECGGHFNWDPRTMFSATAVQIAGPREPLEHQFVCFNHHIARTYGFEPWRDKLGRTHFVNPQADFFPHPFRDRLVRLLPRRWRPPCALFLSPRLTVKRFGWRRAPLARAAARVRSRAWRLWWAWCDVWHGHRWSQLPWGPPEPCRRCGRFDEHEDRGLRGRLGFR